MKAIFFDGYCNLCNSFIDFLIKRDSKEILKFSSLQSESAKKLLPSHFLENVSPETVIYLRDGKVYDKSTAVIKIMCDIGGFYKIFLIGFIFPKFFRDSIYDFIARNRYKIFGKSETCRLPTENEKARFLN